MTTDTFSPFQGRKADAARGGGLSALLSLTSSGAVRQGRIGLPPEGLAVLPHAPGDHAKFGLPCSGDCTVYSPRE
jgi:hypothetical protein